MKELFISIGFIMFIQWVVCLFTLALNSSVEFDPTWGATLTKKQFWTWILVPIYPFILITVKAFKRLP